MADPKSLPTAEQLRRQAHIILELADEFDMPSRSTVRSDSLIAHVEQAADDVRASVRGRPLR